MREKELNILIAKYQAGLCTPKEIKIIEGYLDSCQSDDNRWVEKKHGNQEEVKRRVLSNIKREIQPSKLLKLNFSLLYKIAASVIIFFVIGYGMYRKISIEPIPEKIQIVTKEIPKGQKSLVHLIDGTTIYMNSETRLSYPKIFSNDVREVILEGEAFFEVTPNPNKPFIVRTGDIETTVLGTSFNINTNYDKIKITVATGKVQIQNSNPDIQYEGLAVLKTNEQLVFDKIDQSIIVNEVDASRFQAWKDKRLIFKDENILQVANTLEKWYDVEIVFKNKNIEQCVFTGVFDNEPLTTVLETLQNVADIKFILQGKKIQLSGVGCTQ